MDWPVQFAFQLWRQLELPPTNERTFATAEENKSLWDCWRQERARERQRQREKENQCAPGITPLSLARKSALNPSSFPSWFTNVYKILAAS